MQWTKNNTAARAMTLDQWNFGCRIFMIFSFDRVREQLMLRPSSSGPALGRAAAVQVMNRQPKRERRPWCRSTGRVRDISEAL